LRILLAYLCPYGERKDYYLSLLPHGLTSIAAYLGEKGHDVILANFSSAGYRRAAGEIVKIRPDVLGVSVFSYNRTDSLRLAAAAKKAMPELTVVIGGQHASFLADEILKRFPGIDHVVRGEGETAFLELIKNIEMKKKNPAILNGDRIGNLDSLPSPPSFSGRMIGVNPNEQFKYVVTTRGCPNTCTFCTSPRFWKRGVEFRSPENILDELRLANERFGIIYFSIRDDNFTLRKDRVLKFCKMLAGSGMHLMWNCQARADTVDEEMLVEMKKAGLEHIQYGVESGSDRILAMYDKSLKISDIVRAAEATRRVGIYLSIYLMSGMTGEKHSDVRKTVALIRKILPGDGIISPVAYYPGTVLYEDSKKDGLIDDGIWFRKADPGIFVRGDADGWIREISDALGRIRSSSWYTEKDFAGHRQVAGTSCWVTDILEGDYFLDEERYDRAANSYNRVTGSMPENIWGHLRMGKLSFFTDDYEGAAGFYARVTELAPAYYGGWLKLAESLLAQGRRKNALNCAKKAADLNHFDPRISNLIGILKRRG